MAEQASKTKQPVSPADDIRFKCQRCGKSKPLAEMRSVTRFLPALIVCADCAKELR